MTTESHPPTRSRYRNDAVFRSAQRLVDSRLKAPAPRRQSRGFYFGGGLAIGLGLALLAPRLWRETTPPTKAEAPASLAAPAAAPKAARPAVPTPAPAVPIRIAPPPVVAEASPPAVVADPEATPDDVVELEELITHKPAPAGAASAGWAYTTGNITRFAPTLLLRGELKSDYPVLPPQKIEFEIYRLAAPNNSRLRGTVRYFRGEESVAELGVDGNLSGRTLALREVAPQGQGLPTVPGRRHFFIPLPGVGATGPISGTWSRTGTRGTLTLEIAPPW